MPHDLEVEDSQTPDVLAGLAVGSGCLSRSWGAGERDRAGVRAGEAPAGSEGVHQDRLRVWFWGIREAVVHRAGGRAVTVTITWAVFKNRNCSRCRGWSPNQCFWHLAATVAFWAASHRSALSWALSLRFCS